MPRNRFDDAIAIQQGACNPSGIARALAAACKECLDQGVAQRTDPAVRLIAHQLAYILNVRELDDSLDAYRQATQACEDARAAFLDAAEHAAFLTAATAD